MPGTQDIFRWIIDAGASCAALLILAYGVMLLQRQPARRLRIGELALIGCLILGILQAIPATRFSLHLVEIGQPVRLPWFDDAGGIPASPTHATPGPTPSARTTPHPPTHILPPYLTNWRNDLLTIYMLAILLMTTRLLFAHRALRHLARRSQPPTAPLATLWQKITRTAPRPITLRISHQAARPLTFGLRRPIILIPAALAHAQPADLSAILHHELGHVERRDARTWILAALVNLAFFFLPILWLVKREMRLAQEFLADRAAAQTTGSVEYAQIMLRLVSLTHPRNRSHRSLAMGAWNTWLPKSDLRLRIKHLFNVTAILERRCTRRWSAAAAACILLVTLGLAAVTLADTSTQSQLRTAELRGVAFLLARQESNGGWLTAVGPAPTALVVRSLLQAGVPANHPAILNARNYVATCHQADGGYYTDGEPTYQTAIVMSMYAAFNDPDARQRVQAGRQFLQHEMDRPAKTPGPWYQNTPQSALSPAAPFADPNERAADAILETYGSLTYTRWKSLVYAGLQQQDARVVQATRWLTNHWTLDKHPGTGSAEGLFYYYLAAARTLKAAGAEKIAGHNWREELDQKLLHTQSPDGSWINSQSPRWLENRPEMVTAYALLALQETRR